jgi:hypothetical protein
MAKISKKAATRMADLIEQHANMTKISKLKEQELIAAEKANDGVAMDEAKAWYYTAERSLYHAVIALHEEFGVDLSLLPIAQRHLTFVQKQEQFYHGRMVAAKTHATNVAVAAAMRQH